LNARSLAYCIPPIGNETDRLRLRYSVKWRATADEDGHYRFPVAL